MEDMDLDLSGELEMVAVPKENEENEDKKSTKKSTKKVKREEDNAPVSCLRKEKITVRFLPRSGGIWGNNPKHILAGGLAEGAVRVFDVPKLTSGVYVNVLTDAEKTYLEEILGLDYNALSVYKKHDNFWDNSNEEGVNRVRLTKDDTYLDLSQPEDYIKYKILLANKNLIAPSLKAYEDMPKPSYQFVLIGENEETLKATVNMNTMMQCYKEFGKIEDDFNTLKTVVELIDGRPISKNTKLEFLKAKANELIQLNNKMFLKVVTDPLLSSKVLLKNAMEASIISNRDGKLYLRKDNTPLCEHNEEPTLNNAAKFINDSRHQEIKFSIEAQLK